MSLVTTAMLCLATLSVAISGLLCVGNPLDVSLPTGLWTSPCWQALGRLPAGILILKEENNHLDKLDR